MNFNQGNQFISLISKEELDETIKKLNNKTCSGIDGNSNKMIKNLTPLFRIVLLNLFNRSIWESKIPKDWKKCEITMIPKKNIDLEIPKSYRPISMTSCLAKLCEKLMLNRINQFLKWNKIIIIQQSGFRSHR